jgi:hypothetical protein
MSRISRKTPQFDNYFGRGILAGINYIFDDVIFAAKSIFLVMM